MNLLGIDVELLEATYSCNFRNNLFRIVRTTPGSGVATRGTASLSLMRNLVVIGHSAGPTASRWHSCPEIAALRDCLQASRQTPGQGFPATIDLIETDLPFRPWIKKGLTWRPLEELCSTSCPAPRTASHAGFPMGTLEINNLRKVYFAYLSQLAEAREVTRASSHHWGSYYTKMASEAIAGRCQGSRYFGGLKEGSIRLAPFSTGVSKETASLVEARTRDIVDGRLQIFAGPLKDSDGNERVPAGAALKDVDLQKAFWLIEGVSDLRL